MKNLLILIVSSGLFFISCKKDRVCDCTVTTNGTTSTHTQSSIAGIDTTVVTPLNTSNTNSITFYKVTKGTAKDNCFNKSESVNETSTNGLPGLLSIIITNTGTRNYDCTLK